MDGQVRPAAWFVKLTRMRDWPGGSAGGRVAGKTDKPKDYEPTTDYRFSRHSAALLGKNAVCHRGRRAWGAHTTVVPAQRHSDGGT